MSRSAATALGRIGSRQGGVRAAGICTGRDNDCLSDHAIIYALIEINDQESTLVGIADANPQIRRTALIALDGMESGGLNRDLVGGLLDTDDLALQAQQSKLSLAAAGRMNSSTFVSNG